MYLFCIYQALLITPSNKAIIAITSKMCIKPPAWLTKNPKIHPITRITAIMYNKLLMMLFVFVKVLVECTLTYQNLFQKVIK